ncbi:cyclodeaminase/cyclohydrolase family protein [Candidatus Aerophobetes bacterium]|nr:cyclodeaminase/cyclohydrolase family protein [Candidatus Aerophobetes bacterium]
MERALLSSSLREFIEETSSKTPIPGGGSVAALIGALGASLLCMVANFTIGKKRFRDVEEKVKSILEDIEKAKLELSRLVEEDAKDYLRFSQRDRDNENACQEILKEITLTPLKTSKLSLKVIRLARELLGRSNPYLISDIAVGVLLAEAALRSAGFNVQINLKSIKDEKFKKEKKDILSATLSEGRRIKEEIIKEIESILTV